MANILVIDDDLLILEVLSKFLKKMGHQVQSSSHPNDALQILQSEAVFELIFCDVQMPAMNGFDLYQKYKSDDKKHARFVLISGQVDLMNAQLAYNLGVDELVLKPFDFDILKLVVEYLLEVETTEAVQNESYISLPIEEMIVSGKSLHNLFLKIDGKFVCVTKAGQEFTPQRLKNFADKGVRSVFLTAHDFAKYTDFQFAIANTVKLRPIDNAKKMIAFKHLISTVSKNSFVNAMDKETMTRALDAFETYANVAFTSQKLSGLMVSLIKERPDLAEKSSMLATISSAVADLWHWNSPKIQSKIVMGAMLCDIGLKNFLHLQQKERLNYTKEEAIEYEEHPMRSFTMLSEIGGLPDDVLQIALQHHENSMGNGFPQKLEKNKVHSFSKLVHGVNEFIEIFCRQKTAPDVKKALDDVFNLQRKLVSEQVLKSLYIIFKVQVPKELEGLLLPNKVGRLL
jgi:response regulator RpfG family c-di-GMP phosphodiesterase